MGKKRSKCSKKGIELHYNGFALNRPRSIGVRVEALVIQPY